MRTGQDFMAQNDDLVLYTAQYDNVSAALADLDAVEQLRRKRQPQADRLT
jgi:hypothetical protein